MNADGEIKNGATNEYETRREESVADIHSITSQPRTRAVKIFFRSLRLRWYIRYPKEIMKMERNFSEFQRWLQK